MGVPVIKSVLGLCAVLLRLVLPARGLHAAPRGAADFVQVNAAPTPAPRVQVDGAGRVPAPRTTSRVRRYAPAVPDSWSPYGPPVPWTPIVRPENVNPQAEIVRPYYVAHERATGAAR